MVAALACFAAGAQEQSAGGAFDVASVKPAAGIRTGGYRHQITPTSLTMLHVSMGHCLRLAYDIETAYQLVGPAWLDPPTEYEYDVVAKVSGPATEEQIKGMLRTLLAERFRLQAHRETRELPAYALLRVRASTSLHRSAGTGPTRVLPGEKPYIFRFENLSMPQLALQLGPPWTTRPVVDETGLTGSYDFALDVSRYVLDPDTGKAILDYRGAIDLEGALLRALPEQLGLALKPVRAPYPVLVVDHVEKVPTAN